MSQQATSRSYRGIPSTVRAIAAAIRKIVSPCRPFTSRRRKSTSLNPHPGLGPALAGATAGLALCLGIACPLSAQERGRVLGRVTSAESGEPLAGATVRVRETSLGAVTGEEGAFRVPDVPAGRQELVISRLGYRTRTLAVSVQAGGTEQVEVQLEIRPVESRGIRVSVLRPDLHPQASLEERELREANPKDSGELLRKLSGVDAIRRGPVGLDPSVRALRETEVGTYLNGTRMFPAGPARMDSPLTHFDPSAVSDIEVVKGPYALTWGAGNLSAIRVETQPLPARGDDGIHGDLSGGFDSNREAAETTARISGRSGDVAYSVLGAWRTGDDYESGGDVRIPADFESMEGRGKLAVDLSDESRLTFSGGYQDQGPIEYPGRLLTAKFFETINISGRYELSRGDGGLRSLELQAYVNDVDHQMDNSGKPTARPMEGRMPPFALDVLVDSKMTVSGGRVNAELAAGGGWTLEVGGDAYSANRDAVRTIRRKEDQQLLFEDLMWPDATITDAGVYTRARRRVGDDVRASGTLRVDYVRADADTASEFFMENVTGDLDETEVNLSGALSLGVDVAEHWTLSLGIGSAVRTADATERYSDRIPATKVQTSAEFMGNPDLDPERSTQADAWLEGSFQRLAVQLNAWGRTMDDYITIEPTNLEKRLPLSPETVFRYMNGKASFLGVESSVSYALSSLLTLDATSAYQWGKDETLDEPALGVHPFRGSLGLRLEPPGGRYFAEATLTGVTEQDRVAESRFETPTDGYQLVDFKGGVQVWRGLNVRVGVENLTDEFYVNHLNAKNPFSGEQIPEAGRVFFTDVSYSF